MTIRTPSQAIAAARAQKTNVPGTCQLTVRGWLGAASVGDFDGDGAADAEDGWKSEPVGARHFDKHGKPGYPGSYIGGSRDMGHRVLFVGPGRVRSTDFNSITKRYDAGVVGEGGVDEVGRAMGVTWAGWSETIDGLTIPHDPVKKGWRVKKAQKLTKDAARKPGTRRARLLARIERLFGKIPGK